jgi:hypothetical protein
MSEILSLRVMENHVNRIRDNGVEEKRICALSDNR